MTAQHHFDDERGGSSFAATNCVVGSAITKAIHHYFDSEGGVVIHSEELDRRVNNMRKPRLRLSPERTTSCVNRPKTR